MPVNHVLRFAKTRWMMGKNPTHRQTLPLGVYASTGQAWFNDPFEGHRPRSDMDALSKLVQQPYNDQIAVRNNLLIMHPDADLSALDSSLEKYREIAKNSFKIVNRKFGVSCWHKSEYESEAMWKLYSKLDQGIAIEST